MNQLQKLSKQVHVAIDSWVKHTFAEPFRDHLGASLIGKPCSRQLWYGFRWVAKSDYTKINEETGEAYDDEPRMQRLFRRGHSEEDRFISYLRGIGAQVREFDGVKPDGSPAQIRISDVGGHFGGSLDTEILWPEWLRVPVVTLGEFKTYGKKAWAKLKKHGLGNPDGYGGIVKGEHVAQMNTYAFKRRLPLAFYMATEKDTDELHTEFREPDWKHGASMIDKASLIIRSPVPPPRISENPTVFECRYCDFKRICHEGAPPSEINCRSCKYAEPRPGPIWHCHKNGQTIPPEIVRTGCRVHEAITRT